MLLEMRVVSDLFLNVPRPSVTTSISRRRAPTRLWGRDCQSGRQEQRVSSQTREPAAGPAACRLDYPAVAVTPKDRPSDQLPRGGARPRQLPRPKECPNFGRVFALPFK